MLSIQIETSPLGSIFLLKTTVKYWSLKVGIVGEGARQASSTIPTATSPRSLVRGQRTGRKGTRTDHHLGIQNSKGSKQEKEGHLTILPTGSVLQLPQLHIKSLPSRTRCTTFWSPLSSSLPPHLPQSLLLPCFHMHTHTHTHRHCPLTYCSYSSIVQCCPGWAHV